MKNNRELTPAEKQEIRRKLADIDFLYSADRREINRMFRMVDDSQLWPICGRFNATERAIRRVSRIERASGTMSGYEYASVVDAELGRIVNS